MPNLTLPRTSRRSTCRMFGMVIAPPITNASDGSHAPARSRKPMIVDGSVMPEMMRPMPNIRPTANAPIAFIADLQESRWRTTYTVANPASMNAMVATRERGERRDSPQKTWPLVQPDP